MHTNTRAGPFFTFSRPLLRIKCAARWYCFMRNMHCANQYTSRASPLLNDTTLSAQNNAELYRCCTKRLVHKLQLNTIQATSYLFYIVTYCNLYPIMLTKSIYDFTSRRYFSTLMICSDFTFASHSPSMFKVPTQCNQHSTIVIKFPTIGLVKTSAFRTVLWVLSSGM
jgi:hypothetical protein